jgi:hypothetical protein
MMNAIQLQDQAEEFGDGYSNEFQRQHAWSRINRPMVNERPKALGLLARGETVVLCSVPVFCPHTDGLMGEDVKIVAHGSDYETVVGSCLNLLAASAEDLGDERYEVLSKNAPKQEPVVISHPEDDVPF